ncbi:MAG TPA: malto-oligosyltrehalose trehalohydrolase [Terriglobales bacterium]|nr:malto-oligosyltrehalose trehalohydrolase [Terriglobales bacterium]
MRIQARTATFGAITSGSRTEVRVWAPAARELVVRLLDKPGAGDGYREFPLKRQAGDVFTALLEAGPGGRYFYRVNGGKPVPDPVSRLLPEGVHGPTEIVDPNAFRWTDDAWRGLRPEDYVLYELHVGTFSREGTFDGILQRLEYLRDVGVTVIELMPVAAFPGTRNWGYDGVAWYAVQASYGGPEGLKTLVNAAHAAGLAVVLDVVYNHLGNEGNYLPMFGPYLTGRYPTPWGNAINYDGPGSQGVRRYVIENALYWIAEYHLDGLRLDAVQTMHDASQPHILAEIGENVQELARELGRTVCVIAETDENDGRIVRPARRGGYGLDALWSDDFHHAVHAYFTGERRGYYQDFGRPEQIARALEQGFVYQGEYFQFWERPRGTPARDMRLPQHVICIQNHDQVGNRALGERLHHLVPRGVRRLMAALLLLAPETPLLFMGQEYDEAAPFLFFTDFSDPELQRAVGDGRRREFREFNWDEVPDPQDPQTFELSKLNWDLALHGHNAMLKWHRDVLDLRRRVVLPAERTCRARIVNEMLFLDVAAVRPVLRVTASLAPGADAPGEPGWEEALASEEDGYAVRIFLAAASESSPSSAAP